MKEFEQLKIEIPELETEKKEPEVKEPEIKEYHFRQWFYGDYLGYYPVKAKSAKQAWAIFLKENPQYAKETRVKGYFAMLLP
jgi:hypothetical protein